jgi:hypothetical protein
LSASLKNSQNVHRGKTVMDAAQTLMEYSENPSASKKDSAAEKSGKKARDASLMICAVRA